jgi:hypothetical protein
MWFKYPLLILFFILLALAQVSFLSRLSIAGNLVFVLFFLLVFFEKPSHYIQGVAATMAAGILLDIFGSFAFGPAIVSLFCVYSLIKLTGYFLRERQGNYLFLYFMSMFLVSLALYDLLYALGISSFHSTITFNLTYALGLACNAILASAGFLLYPYRKPKQLKLF